jgi:hypothetical protein
VGVASFWKIESNIGSQDLVERVKRLTSELSTSTSISN